MYFPEQIFRQAFLIISDLYSNMYRELQNIKKEKKNI